jgi:hypothetical protein
MMIDQYTVQAGKGQATLDLTGFVCDAGKTCQVCSDK